jgi:two-component system sensor histidine kinase PhoQ
MKRLVQNQFRRRILFSFLSVVITFLLLNGYLRYQNTKTELMSAYTLSLLRQIPAIINEAMPSGLIPHITTSQHYASETKTIATAICSDKHQLLWHSFHNPPQNIDRFCQNLNSEPYTPTLYNASNSKKYIYYSIPFHAFNNLPERRLVILKRMTAEIGTLEHLQLQLALWYLAIIIIAALGVLWGYKHSFHPLNTLHKELKEIKKNNQERLYYSYPEELAPIAKTLNRLLEQQEEQSEKYKKAMDDLAHSLKTRVATCDALLYQKQPPISEIMEQLHDMDSVIQHQLKRALMGSRGISKHHTQVSPILEKLTKMFNKIHQARTIEFIHNYEKDQTLPINYNDLMEVLGNILENSYRFANNYIILSIVERSEGFSVHIENDGDTLPENKMNSVFQRGVRADEKNPGTGIGLAVCEEIVSSYHGQIWFQAQDIGTRLEIFLPHQN